MKTVSIKFLLYVQGITKLLQVLITMQNGLEHWILQNSEFQPRKLVETIEWFGCIYFFCLFVFLLLLFKKDGLTQMCLTFVAKKFFFVLMWGGGRRKKKKQKCKPNAVIISTNVSYLANGSVFPPKENLWIKICGKWNLTFDLHCTILSPL